MSRRRPSLDCQAAVERDVLAAAWSEAQGARRRIDKFPSAAVAQERSDDGDCDSSKDREALAGYAGRPETYSKSRARKLKA